MSAVVFAEGRLATCQRTRNSSRLVGLRTVVNPPCLSSILKRERGGGTRDGRQAIYDEGALCTREIMYAVRSRDKV